MLAEYVAFTLVWLIPMLGWIVLLERRLSKIETKIELIINGLKNHDKLRKES